ncbi:MAG TPA: O-antigen ligase family protein [Prolixibacteraceae bacterium]|nr:O-antigen ligase family protein [Prolixibacteraceae bacterium]
MDKFDPVFGSGRIRSPFFIALILLITLASAFLMAKGGLIISIMLMVLPLGLIILNRIFNAPYIGFIIVFFANFFMLGINRYIPGPLGLTIDGLLILTYLSLFFRSFNQPVNWSLAKSDLTLLAGIWFGYTLFQLVNPEAVSRAAWFYAMRGVSLYMLLTIPLTFILLDREKDLNLILMLWGIFSLLGTLKGMMQQYIGVDPFEQQWLNEGGAVTHMLFGKLRVFSFYTDAGQFGAAQGQAAVVFGILALNVKNLKLKLFYTLVAIAGIYGMMVSGTRGAIAVPIMGFALYFILIKNIKVMILGALMGISVFVFFKYTSIAQGNYQIRRMRSAFDPNDPSLQVRFENQRKLKTYLASRPFGGGLGSAGNWGKRFSPNTFLANTATDSWYVAIWAENGIIGLLLHLFILFYVLIKSSYVLMFKIRNDWLKFRMIALVSGYFGIMAASYGNGVLGQMPTGIIIYMSMAFLFMAEKFDKELEDQNAQNSKLLV